MAALVNIGGLELEVVSIVLGFAIGYIIGSMKGRASMGMMT